MLTTHSVDVEHLRQLDEPMEESHPLPPGRFDLIKEGPLYVYFFDDEDGSEEDAEIVSTMLLRT